MTVSVYGGIFFVHSQVFLSSWMLSRQEVYDLCWPKGAKFKIFGEKSLSYLCHALVVIFQELFSGMLSGIAPNSLQQ